MKVLKILRSIFIPVAIALAVAPVVYYIVRNNGVDFNEVIEGMKTIFTNLKEYFDAAMLMVIAMLACAGVGAITFIVWIVCSIIKRKPLHMLLGLLSLVVLVIGTVGAMMNGSMFLTDSEEIELIYVICVFAEMAAALLMFVACIIDTVFMSKLRKQEKKEKKAGKPAKAEEKAVEVKEEPKAKDKKVEEVEEEEDFYLPFLHEKSKPEEKPRITYEIDSNHVRQSGVNFGLSHVFMTDAEVAAIIAATPSSRVEDDELPAMFDPDFVSPSAQVEPEEEMSMEDIPPCCRPDFVAPEEDRLPMFGEPKTKVIIKEVIKEVPVEVQVPVETPVYVTPAPKKHVKGAKPVHISKVAEGYQVKLVGANKPAGIYDSEEEAIAAARKIVEKTGAGIRLHDAEGKIRSI